MESAPDWYALFVAADRCHTTPWDMLERASFWRDKALIASQAERQAQKIIDEH
jgi:hypothetical protein